MDYTYTDQNTFKTLVELIRADGWAISLIKIEPYNKLMFEIEAVKYHVPIIISVIVNKYHSIIGNKFRHNHAQSTTFHKSKDG